MILIPETYNYIAAFLTLNCNLRCSYCINRFGELAPRKLMSGDEWIAAINRIESRPDLPVTLQGGEPTLHPDFYKIVNGIKPELNIDLLTNLQFDINEFTANVKPERIKRDAPYASIRVSYHPEQMDYLELIVKVIKLLRKGYSVGVWAVDHPDFKESIYWMKMECKHYGIDFRLKEFLGEHKGNLYGEYKYPDSIAQKETKTVNCKTTELIIGPDGNTYRCHSDLYASRFNLGHINGPYEIKDIFRSCGYYGHCNPCDVKNKTNRFQKFGHTSVEIKE